MKMKLNFAALAGVSLIAMAAPALAQDEQQVATEGAQPGATVPNTNAAASDAGQNEELVVTATRRANRIQDVPLAVNALSGDQLTESGFQSLQDIQYQFSGVQFGTAPNDSGFRLRGVGSSGFSSSSEQNVATVVDNVVVPFGNPVQSLGDLDRVEVLKGPQGTQFGKNSSSGVVNITTRRPDLDAFGGSFFASYGELDEHNVNGSLNLPIGGEAAFAIFAYHRQFDGYVDNVVQGRDWGGEESYGVRARLLWEPSDDFSAYLIGDWSRLQQEGAGQLWTVNQLPPFVDPLNAVRYSSITALGIQPGFDNDESAEEFSGDGEERNYGASLELNLALGEHSLTSITAYRRLDVRPREFAIDATPFPVFTARETGNDQSFLSQEVRLTSPSGGTLEYVAGFYLSRRKAGLNATQSAQLRPALPFSPNPQLSITAGLSTTRTDTDSAALFVDGSIRISDTLRILLGGRYSYDWVDAESFSVIDPAYPPGPGPNGFTIPYAPRPLATGSIDKGDWSGRGGFEWTPADDVMFYATVARGYLGPTITFSGLTGTRSEVDPQTVRDITIGWRTQFFDRHFTFNGNIFWDKYRNLQTAVFNGFEFLTENAGGFEAKGFELEGIVRLSPALSVNASYTFSDAEFTDYVTSCPNSILAAGPAAIAAQCNAPGSTPAQPLFQAAGEPLPGAPRHSFTLGADFNQSLGSRLSFDFSANYYFRSSTQNSVGDPNTEHPSYDLLGLRAGVGAEDGRWRVGVFARNVFDTLFHSAIIGLPFGPPGGYVNWNTREGRRTIGVSGEFRF